MKCGRGQEGGVFDNRRINARPQRQPRGQPKNRPVNLCTRNYQLKRDSRIPMNPQSRTLSPPVLHNDAVSPLFQAVIEATEEAVYNSLFMGKTTTRVDNHTVQALPIAKVLEICRKYNVLR